MAYRVEAGDDLIPTIVTPATVTSSSTASPTEILTAAPHGFADGSTVVIAGHSGSSNDGAVNASHTITLVDSTRFTIPVDLTGGGGTGGTATGEVLQTLSLSDFGGDTPKFLIMQSTASTSDGNYQDDLFFSFGWGNISDRKESVQSFSEDNVGTSVVVRSLQRTVITILNSAGDILDECIIKSFSADEVVIAWTVLEGVAKTFQYLVLGGSTLTDVFLGEFSMATSAETLTDSGIAFVDGGGGADTMTLAVGDWSALFNAGDVIEVSGSASNDGFYTIVSVTASVITLATGVLTAEGAGASVTIRSGYIDVAGLGFDDVDAVMMMTSQNDNGNAAPGTINVNSREAAFSFGFFDVDNGSQCSESRIYSEHTAATMDTFSRDGVNTKCWSHSSFKSGVWAVRGDLTFVSVIPDGFRLKQTLGSTVPAVAYRVNLAALKGGNYECVQKTAPTSVGTQDIVNTGAFTPSGSMFLFGQSGAPSIAAMSIGWASNKDGTKANTKEGVMFVSDDNGADPSDTKRLTKTDKCLVHDAAGSTAVDNEANVEAWNSNGVTVDFTTASAANVYHAIMFGDGTVTPVSEEVRSQPVFASANVMRV